MLQGFRIPMLVGLAAASLGGVLACSSTDSVDFLSGDPAFSRLVFDPLTLSPAHNKVMARGSAQTFHLDVGYMLKQQDFPSPQLRTVIRLLHFPNGGRTVDCTVFDNTVALPGQTGSFVSEGSFTVPSASTCPVTGQATANEYLELRAVVNAPSGQQVFDTANYIVK